MENIVVPAYFTEPVTVSNWADLFHLYEDLLVPVREYEAVAEQKASAENTQKQAKNTVSSAFFLPFAYAVSRTLLFAIPWVIFFLILFNVKHNAEGVKWITLYDEWYGKLWLVEKINAVLAPGNIPVWLGVILTFTHYLIIENVLAPVVLFLLPLMFGVSIITTIFSVIHAKAMISSTQKKIDRLDAELSARLDDLSDPISYVPPDYRFSDAIEYFYKSYANGKAENLQEALLQYDEHVHRQSMQEGQQELLTAHNEILRSLSYQSAQIDRLQSKINRINRKIGWF